MDFSPQVVTSPARRSMPPVGLCADCKPNACGGLHIKRSSRRNELLIRNKKFAGSSSVNGMKRDVCVDQPDSFLPAVRFRFVVRFAWAESVSSPRKAGSTSYQPDSKCTTAPPRSPPRAHTKTHCLSPGSRLFPSLQSVSSVSIARHEQVAPRHG